MKSLGSRCCCLVRAGAVLLPLWAASIQAQQVPPLLRDVEQPRTQRISASGGILILGANMLVSGLTSGVLNKHHGGSFTAAFTRGAVGGAAVFAGKALVVRPGTAAPLIGRQVAALGASAVRNAGAGQDLLEDVSLPVGPLRLHVAPGHKRAPWLSVDVLGVAGIATVLLSYDARLDWGETLATATPVFSVADPDDRLPWNGRHVAGLLMVRDPAGSLRPMSTDETLAHERVHLVEYDQMTQLWSAPLERALLDNWSWGRRIQPYVDLSISAGLNAAFRLLPTDRNPVEVEANYFSAWR